MKEEYISHFFDLDIYIVFGKESNSYEARKNGDAIYKVSRIYNTAKMLMWFLEIVAKLETTKDESKNNNK